MSTKAAKTKTLRDLFMAELADIYDAEHRIAKALPKLAKAATSEDLKEAFLSHLKETESHAAKLEKVFHLFGETAKGKKCEGTVGLLEEGDEIATDFAGSKAINAALISAAQKVEHYEIASYDCLQEWAGLLGQSKAATLLGQILADEEAANAKLTELAENSSNEEALASDDEELAGAGRESSARSRRKAS